MLLFHSTYMYVNLGVCTDPYYFCSLYRFAASEKLLKMIFLYHGGLRYPVFLSPANIKCCPIFRDTIPLTIFSLYSCLLVTANDLIGSTISCVSSGSIPGTNRQQRYHPPDRTGFLFFFFLRIRIVGSARIQICWFGFRMDPDLWG